MRAQILLITCLGLVACEKKSDDVVAQPETSQKRGTLARAPIQKATIKPRTNPHGNKQTLVKQPASMPTSRPTSQPTSMPTARSGFIAGKITLAPGLEKYVRAGQTLYISVRQDAGDGKRGMMLAAQKVDVTGPSIFPLKYRLTGQDVMMQGTVLAGRIRVYARIDQDGDAMSKQPGDVTGLVQGARNVGETGIDLLLDSVIK